MSAVIQASETLISMRAMSAESYDTKLRKASAAVATLRDVLPELIRVQERIVSDSAALGPSVSGRKLYEMRRLQASLVDLVDPFYELLNSTKGYKWRLMAMIIFKICKNRYPSGSNSKHGPIVRFIVGMARRVEYSLVPATVESYLREEGLN